MFAVGCLISRISSFGKFYYRLPSNCHFDCCLSCSWINFRKVADRPRDPAKWGEIADVVAALSIPVIANGDVFEYDDFQNIKTATGRHSCYFSCALTSLSHAWNFFSNEF